MGFIGELDKIETFSKSIMELYNIGCRDKFKYQECLKSYVPKIVGSKDDSLIVTLQNHMDEQRNLALYESNNNVVRMKFGFEYLYNCLWKYIRKQGIGHISDLCIKGNTYIITINISLGLNKDVNESRDAFNKRNDNFIKNTPYTYDYDSLINSYKIKNSSENIELLFALFHKLFDFKHYEIDTRNGYLRQITICTKNITLPSNDNIIELSEDARFESIFKDAKELYQSVNTVRDFPSVWENIQSLISTLYYNLCIKLHYHCEYTQEYETIKLSHKEINKDTNNRVETIGSTVSPSEVLEIASKILNNLYDYIESKYCAHSTLTMSKFGIVGELVFMREIAIMNGKKKFIFDQYKNIDWDEYEYIIDYKYIKEISNFLKDDNIDVTNLSVKTYSGFGCTSAFGIDRINFNIFNTLALNRWKGDE